ncbi:MAG: glutamate--tRNA ligase [Clostridia bacterium]|nr:glutamate--tRNA ligase [Clostridia bacterium]
MTVRTRFAPSPTGYMHVGNLRTALYTYLIAKQNDGKFILRIEDTDQERYVEGAVDLIYRTMKETGMNWDEGPDVGGDYGPYIQSERRGLYMEYAKMLVEKGAAYYCFCDKERLDELKLIHSISKVPHKYDGHCRNLSKEEIEEKLAAGVPFVIRQKIPTEGSTTFQDEIYGEITVDNSELDDQILVKTDGLPTYNFANVVDDHLMNITHVVRGKEYLSSAPKYNLLYEAFGWEIPKYIHCAPVMKDAQNKLSKRNGDASYEDLIKKGYLKDAVINYIALLGWAPKSEQEKFTLEELIKEFDIAGISKSPAIFDNEKLAWLNGEYIKALPAEEFLAMAMPFIQESVKRTDVDFASLAALLQGRCQILNEIPEMIDFIDALPEYDIALYTHKKMKTNPENSLESLKAILPVLEAVTDWTQENIHTALFDLIAKLEVKNGLILWPLRTALSGKQFTPGGGVELAYLLGKEETLARIQKGIEKLS